MSYGACQACPNAVAAWSLTATAVAAWPQAELLCLEHLRKLLEARQLAAQAAERELLRRWCACGRELYFRAVQREALGDACHWCKLGHPRAVDVVDRGQLALRASGQHYREQLCEAVDEDGKLCGAKMCWRLTYLPDQPVRCAKHGAKAREETITA